MVYMSLKHQVFKEVHMKIDIKEESQLEIESTFSFNVNYNEDYSSCIASLRQEVKLKNNPSKFSIVVEGLGHYSCEGILNEQDKKMAHIESYTLLFPYIQNMVAKLALCAGLPPLMIERAKLKPEDIKFDNAQ